MRILLVQTGFLGDVILSTPLIAAIRRLHPGAELWMSVTPQARDLVKADPLLAGVLVFDKRGSHRGLAGLWRFVLELKRRRFSRAYAVHRSYRTALMLWLARIPERTGFISAALPFLYHVRAQRRRDGHDVCRNLSLLAAEAPLNELDDEIRLFVDEGEALSPAVGNFLELGQDYAVVVPGSAWHTKRWHAAGYRRLVEHLLRTKRAVVVLGSAGEMEAGRQVAEGLPVTNLTGLTTLAESMRIIKNARVVVCNDSMALHLASGFKIPTVAVFCATSPSFGFGPWKNRAETVECRGLACKPCRRHGGRACPLGTEACMRELDAAEVIAALERVLQ